MNVNLNPEHLKDLKKNQGVVTKMDGKTVIEGSVIVDKESLTNLIESMDSIRDVATRYHKRELERADAFAEVFKIVGDTI